MGGVNVEKHSCSKCRRTAEFIIVYGCLEEQHIDSAVCCVQHKDELVGLFETEKIHRQKHMAAYTACRICGERIDEYLCQPLSLTFHVGIAADISAELTLTLMEQMQIGMMTVNEAKDKISDLTMQINEITDVLRKAADDDAPPDT
jgi:hypothetical protein